MVGAGEALVAVYMAVVDVEVIETTVAVVPSSKVLT